MLRCPECGAPLRFVTAADFGHFACDGCGGMFEAAAIVEFGLETLRTQLEPYRIVAADWRPETELEAAARARGLRFAPDTFELIYVDEAQRVLIECLHRDLSRYDWRRDYAEAGLLASLFLRPVVAARMSLYTNRRFDYDRSRLVDGWNPATPLIFDCGLLAIGEAGSACLWLADED